MPFLWLAHFFMNVRPIWCIFNNYCNNNNNDNDDNDVVGDDDDNDNNILVYGSLTKSFSWNTENKKIDVLCNYEKLIISSRKPASKLIARFIKSRLNIIELKLDLGNIK